MSVRTLVLLCLGASALVAQTAPAAEPHPTISLQDALDRARKYGGQVQSANVLLLQAKEDTVQTRAARLPSVNAFNQFIYTEPNGTASGVFVANDGVHVYNEQAQVHEELLALIRQGEVKRSMAAEAVARAKVEVATRGLTATVVQDYYAVVTAQRKSANLQTSVREAERFLDITRKQEKGGEVAHSDVIKAQIDLQQRQRDLAESGLGVLKAKMTLGVLIFPGFSFDYSVVDDLQQQPGIPGAVEARAQAVNSSPDVKAAEAEVKETKLGVTVAKYLYLPSLGLDFFYGLNSNQLSVYSTIPGEPGEPPFMRRNLGYSAQATLNIPVWSWGSIRSKVKQAELRHEQARIDLSLAQRTLQSNVATSYAEAQTAQIQLDSLRSSAELAAESLRLTLLRYQAGEATALEVVDSQNTVTQARNAYDEGLARHRVAVANLQILMGTF